MVPCTNSSFSLLRVVCIVGVVGCVGEAEVPAGLAQTAAALNELSTVHYESEASISAEGEVLASSTSGSLTRDVWQRVARPWTFLHEDTIYDELAAIEIAADGSRVMRYQVTSRPNLSPATGEDLEQPAEVVERDAILAQPGDELRVSIQVRGFPEWNIPLLPPPELSSTQEFEDAIEEREAAIGVRQALADSAAADLRQAIEGLGGEIVGVRWTTGSVLVSIPRSELDTLTEIPAVRLVTPTGNMIIDGWELGAGRTAARTEVDTFHSYGFRGGGANAARHAFGDITIAQIETAVPEDEACMFYTSNCSGSNRIRGRYECDNASPRECDSNQGDGQNDYDGVANYLPADEQSGGSSHATLVASVLVADYQNGQGDGATLCDDTAPNPVCGPHNATWENNATGMAPHASIVFFGKRSANTLDDMAANATEVAYTDLNVDVINNSWSSGTGSGCDVRATTAAEMEIENAFDDGVFVAQCIGNNTVNTASCNAYPPADLPKVFAVGSLDADYADCETAYTPDCTLRSTSSARGGGPLTINGTTYSDVESIVDLVAPTNVTFLTQDIGATDTADNAYFGTVLANSQVAGCSIATPHVAGAAAIVKDYMLDEGLTYINSPGRLHAVMLAMGDRHSSSNPSNAAQSTTQSSAGANPYFGLGRLNLRLFESGTGNTPAGRSMRTVSFTSSSSADATFPFGPLPSGVSFFKCVANSAEDMSGKTDVSNVTLTVEKWAAVGGVCTAASGSPAFSVSDATKDTKSVVAYSFSAGDCARVIVSPVYIIPSVGVTVNTFCYYSATDDDS